MYSSGHRGHTFHISATEALGRTLQRAESRISAVIAKKLDDFEPAIVRLKDGLHTSASWEAPGRLDYGSREGEVERRRLERYARLDERMNVDEDPFDDDEENDDPEDSDEVKALKARRRYLLSLQTLRTTICWWIAALFGGNSRMEMRSMLSLLILVHRSRSHYPIV